MNEWAARIMSVFPERNNKADLDQFIQEVSNEDLERMYFQKEFNEVTECRPTYEQISQDRIIEEANKNIAMLKSLEAILNERMQGFNSFSASVSKTRPHFESFEHSECSLKLALDSLYIFVEQELVQSKQNIFLGDLKRSLNEMRTDAQKRITDYQKEIAGAEKDVATAEKKLSKSKEQHDRSMEFKAKMESFELDILINPSRLRSVASSASGKGKDGEESVSKHEREVREDVRNLLRMIGNRDQVLSASRRAFQKLDKECKKAVYLTLRKMAEKEKENATLHLEVMAKFESTVHRVDVDADMDEFIAQSIDKDCGLLTGGAMELSSQALSLLGDLTPTQGRDRSSSTSSRSNNSSACSTPRGSFSAPTISAPNSLSSSNLLASPVRTTSVSSGGASNAFRTPTSKLFSMENLHKQQPPASNEELSSYLSQIFYPHKALTRLGEASAASASGNGGVETERDTVTHSQASSDLHSVKPVANNAPLSSIDGRNSFDGHSHSHSSSHPQQCSAEEEDNPNNRLSKEYQYYKRKSLTTLSPAESEALNAKTIKAEHRKTKVSHDDVQYVALNNNVPTREWLKSNPDPQLVEAVEWMNKAVKSQSGREVFISELNQFRSKKVDVGVGFDALGAVLWTALSYCQAENDIHTAKIIMMLSQTFYRQMEPIAVPAGGKEGVGVRSHHLETLTELVSEGERAGEGGDRNIEEERNNHEDEEEGVVCKRGAEHRQYIKEKLLAHPIWQDGNYWEQALWQCAIEQLQTIPYERAWHDMDKDTRAMSVRRVHDVIFSQVMAITHSMMELGCSNEQCREFLYRMCVIHQLSEAQRQQLLTHVLRNQ